MKSVKSKRILALAGMLALIVLTACQAAGKNPQVIDIPVISATADLSLCQNEFYPQGSPVFGDVTSDQLRGDVDGIKILDIVVGEGDSPTIEDLVTVRYTGWLDGGCVFDSTYSRDEDAELLLVALIPGWRQAMLTMKPGGSRRVEIPSSLGYRDRKSVV